MINLLSGLYNIDVSNHSSYLGSICKEMVNGIPGVIFSSILIYDDNDKKVIYQEIECMESKKNEYDKVKLTNLLNENIFLDVDNSVSGKLIKSDKKYLKINDVLQDSDYQSVELAKLLGFKKGIFLKINNVRKKNVYGLVALYPDEKSAVNYWSHLDLCIIISVLESIISNAKLIREDEILYKIFSSAINKDKHDLSDFLSECVDIIISEISAKGCSIFVLDPIDNLIRLKASLGVRPGPKTKTGINGWDFNNVYYKIGEGVTGRIVKNKEVVVDKNFDTSNSKWIDVGLNKNFVGVPILSVDQEKAIGVIRCTTKPNKLLDNTVESFNQEDADLLIYVAKLISMFMEVYFYK